MAKFSFNLQPRTVKRVDTDNRRIVTKIPVPESLPLLDRIRKYESGNALEQLPVIWDRADGSKIYDKWGNCWIDFTSSIFVTNAGHGSPFVNQQVKALLDKPLMHSYYYPTEIRADFLEALISFTPTNLDKAILLSAGTEATERAIKIAKIFGAQSTNKKNIIIPLNKKLTLFFVRILELSPVKLVTRDNLKSMEIDNTAQINDSYQYKSSLRQLSSYLKKYSD